MTLNERFHITLHHIARRAVSLGRTLAERLAKMRPYYKAAEKLSRSTFNTRNDSEFHTEIGKARILPANIYDAANITVRVTGR